MDIRPIRDEAGYRSALEQIERLWEQAEPGSEELDILDVLATLVEGYEREHESIDPPDPIDAIKFRMEQQGLKRRDLVELIGQRSKVSEVLARRRRLSLSMIRKLHVGLAIPAESLIGPLEIVPQARKRASPARSDVAAKVLRHGKTRKPRAAAR